MSNQNEPKGIKMDPDFERLYQLGVIDELPEEVETTPEDAEGMED